MSSLQDQMEEHWRRDQRNERRLRDCMISISHLLDEYEGNIPPATKKFAENFYQDCQAQINVIVRRWD